MNIVRLESENVMRLVAVEITPDGKPVVLTGDNEQGKSAVLNSIVMALTGKLPDRPIRDGASKARITLDLGDYTITRRITQKGTYLDVYAKDGTKISSPQALLNQLRGDLTIDPMEFSRMKARDQREMLLHDVAKVDLSQWEADYTAAYDARTAANREEKRTEALWQSSVDAPDGTPDEEVSAQEILDEIEAINTKRQERSDAMKERERLDENLNDANDRISAQMTLIEDLKRQLKEAEDNLIALQYDAESARKAVDGHEIPEAPTAENLAAACERLNAVEKTNRDVRVKKAKEQAKKDFLAAKRAAEDADDKVKELEKDKAEKLRNADFGVPGLSVDDNGVTYESIPFGQLSTSRQIHVSTLMAMRQNPRLKIIMIREGALIGSAIWDSICKLAGEHGYQIWVEKMQEEPGKVGLHIRAGEIVAVDGNPIEPKAKPDPEPDEKQPEPVEA